MASGNLGLAEALLMGVRDSSLGFGGQGLGSQCCFLLGSTLRHVQHITPGPGAWRTKCRVMGMQSGSLHEDGYTSGWHFGC